VHAEADQPERDQRRQAEQRGGERAQPLRSLASRQRQEGQREPGRHLDPGRRRERPGGGPRAAGPSAGERQRERHQHDQQRVVVRAPDGQHEQHRVQAHERRRPCGRASRLVRRARTQRDRGEARADGERLHRPQAAGHAERRGAIADEREQGAVGRVLERPADEGEGGVGGRFGGEVRVGIEAVQGAEAREGEVAEHVLGEQRRPQQQHDVGERDRGGQRSQPQLRRGCEHEQVGAADDQHQRLKATRAKRPEADARQWPGQPCGPAAAARRDVGRRLCGGGRDEQEQARQQRQQRQRAEQSDRAEGDAPRSRLGGEAEREGGGERPRWSCGLYGPILASAPPADVHGRR
jgi:hypothetical protein